jgi:hypothetical protein
VHTGKLLLVTSLLSGGCADGLKMFVAQHLSVDADSNLQWRQRMVSQAGVMNLSSTYVRQRALVR